MRSVTMLAMAILLGAAPAFAQAARGGRFDVRALSTRADLVSGGDVLIQIDAPASAGTNVAIIVNGREPNAELKPSPAASSVGGATTLIVRREMGTITLDQFADLNSRVGGHDIDGRVVAARAVADPEAVRIAFQSGRVNDTSKGMAMVPIVDARPHTDGIGDVHDAVNSHVTRARLIAAKRHIRQPGAPHLRAGNQHPARAARQPRRSWEPGTCLAIPRAACPASAEATAVRHSFSDGGRRPPHLRMSWTGV